MSLKTDYCGNMIYENGKLARMLIDGGYITLTGNSPVYHYYLQDHLGNNRVVVQAGGSVEQVNHYYPFGGLFGESTGGGTQPYKYNGKELDRMHGLDWYDYGARHYDAALGRWMCMDPLAEKYYDVTPYGYCGNNPINIIDIHGDSLTMDSQSIMAVYNCLKDGTNITMKFTNGILDPNSIREVAENTDDVFLKDLYEISINPQMVELQTTQSNIYEMNGRIYDEAWKKPVDYNVMNETEPRRSQLINFGYPIGKTIIGNLGQTLYPQKSKELKRSLNNSVVVNINGLGTLNQQSCGIAHELAHVILFLRKLPHSHEGNGEFIYKRQWNVMGRFGYDYLESSSNSIFY
uniref:RHS repeat-associated core domain-containing protein n=1 Tax=Prevotella sp. GTC17262 TaxID=3236797 RepID=A0AB33JFD1_9BACT